MAGGYRNERSGRRNRRRGRRGSEPSNLGNWLLAGGSGLLLFTLVGFFAWNSVTKVDVDPKTMCPLHGPIAVHAMLLDGSDAITPLQAQRLSQVLNRSLTDAAVGERIDLYVLAGDGTQALSPVVSLCRPKSDGNDLYENSKRIKERFDLGFRKPMDEALASMTRAPERKTSPIMESVKAVCVAAFGDLPSGVLSRLTVASDMIQFSPLLNHYKRKDFDDFALTPEFREVLADCHGAKVDVLYLVRPRDAAVQNRKHQLFWEKFFDRENATLLSMETI